MMNAASMRIHCNAKSTFADDDEPGELPLLVLGKPSLLVEERTCRMHIRADSVRRHDAEVLSAAPNYEAAGTPLA